MLHSLIDSGVEVAGVAGVAWTDAPLGLAAPNSPHDPFTQPELSPLAVARSKAGKSLSGLNPFWGIDDTVRYLQSVWLSPVRDSLIARVRSYRSLLTVEENPARPAGPYTTAKRNVLPLVVNGSTDYAIPDTGVSINVITEERAISLGASIDRSTATQDKFTNAFGHSFHSLGTTKLSMKFPWNHRGSTECEFAVVHKCPVPITFGKAFVDTMEIFTKKRHYLVKAALSVTKLGQKLKKAWGLMLMEHHHQRLGCHVDGELVFADADTGAETDIASLAYATTRGWLITPYPDDEGFIVLSNEEVVKVTGYVDTWLNIGGTKALKRFQILDGLPSNIVLGDETLETYRVFTDHEDLFVHGSGLKADDAFCMMQWVQKFDIQERLLDELLGGRQADMTGTTRPKSNQESLSVQAMRLGLRRRLEGLESIEADCRASTAKRLVSLTGDELDRENQSDQDRRERYRKLRQRIRDELDKLPATEPDPSTDATVPKVSRIRRFWSRSRDGNIRP